MAEESSRGFRRFMLDPKSSVMNYIADNIPSEHPSHQQGSNGRVHQAGPTSGQQPNVQDPNGLQQNQIPSHNTQNQAQDGFMHSHLPHRPSQVNSQSSSPRPGYAQPVQSSQLPIAAPYVASNLGHSHHGMDGPAGAQSQFPSSQSVSNLSLAQEPTTQPGQYSSIQNGGQSTATLLGQGPPEPGARRKNSPQSAPRLYHRMVLQYEIIKKAFFAAKSQHNTQEMTSAAYELESSSRRIWALRYEHSWEFGGYSEAGHQAVISKWQAEYEMWADTVLDFHDGQILAGAAYSSKYGDTSTHQETEWDPHSRQDHLGYQNGETPQHIEPMRPEQGPPHTSQQMPPHQQISSLQQIPQQQQFPPSQQIPQMQNLSMSQSVPKPQGIQDGQLPQATPPESFPQNGPPPTFFDQGMPPQQRQQSPRPPQMPFTQTPPPVMQNGQNTQPSHFNGPPNKQNIPTGPAPNVQQPQNIQSGQSPNMQQSQSRPPQQYMHQTQGIPSGSTPNVQQQNMGASQQGPPRNGIPPSQNMMQGQNMGPRLNPSPQPGPQLPASLQAGGQMQGNGRQ